MNHLLKVSVCWMSNFQIPQIHPMQKSIVISKYFISSIMHLSKASNRIGLSSILWQKLQKYRMLNFHNLNSFSWQKTNKRDTVCFNRKCFKKKLLICQAHHTIEIKSLSWDSEEDNANTRSTFEASIPFSVVLALYICFRKGWSYICVFLPVICQMGSFSNVCCFKTQSCLKQHIAPGSSPLWCYSWTQISAASVPVAHFTFNVQFQRRWWSSVQI